MFNLAAETATKSPFHMAHGAVLVRKGVVLSTSSNYYGSNRLSPKCPSTHAEIATLARFLGGNVKKSFEEPSKALITFEMQRKAVAREAKGQTLQVSRPHLQRYPPCQGGPPNRLAITSAPESCIQRAKRKGQGGEEARHVYLRYYEDEGCQKGEETSY